MSSLTLEREEYDVSARIWDWLQRTGHFTCGGWSWDYQQPRVLLCACREALTLPDGVPC